MLLTELGYSASVDVATERLALILAADAEADGGGVMRG
jgi:hypothetical protein